MAADGTTNVTKREFYMSQMLVWLFIMAAFGTSFRNDVRLYNVVFFFAALLQFIWCMFSFLGSRRAA